MVKKILLIGSSALLTLALLSRESLALSIQGPRPFRGCLVNSAVNQSTTTASPYLVQWEIEDYDTDALHSTSSNTSRIVIPAGVSKVKFEGNISWAANVNGYRQIFIYKNGASILGGGNAMTMANTTAGLTTRMNINSGVLRVAAGDYFELGTVQASGGNLNLDCVASGSACWFQMEIVE